MMVNSIKKKVIKSNGFTIISGLQSVAFTHLIIKKAYLEYIVTVCTSLCHSKIPHGVSQQDNIGAALQLIKVLRLVDGVLILVEGVDEVTLEAH